MLVDAPFYGLVPKLPDANLRFRAELLSKAALDKGLQRDLLHVCREDLLYFVNVFAWLYEPRAKKVLPFVTYELQDACLCRHRLAFGKQGVIEEKPRDVGATWMEIYLDLWQFVLFENVDIGMMSRDEDTVDKAGSRGSLFWKLRFGLGLEKGSIGLPSWMFEPKECTSNKGMLKYDVTNCSIVGEAATGNAFRGDRKTRVFCDEFAAFPAGDDRRVAGSLAYVTDNPVYCSTPDPQKGASGEFFEMVQKARASQSALVHINLDWKDHPTRRRGLYTSEEVPLGSRNWKLKKLDVDYKFGVAYPFVLDGKTRSPYRDEKERETNSRQVAIEIDKDYSGATSGFFEHRTIDRLIVETAKPPVMRGTVIYDPDTLEVEFIERDNDEADFLLWVKLLRDPKTGQWLFPKDEDCGVGGDPSGGRGTEHSSNAVLTCFGLKTGVQKWEFVTAHMAPSRLAELAIGLCRWCKGPSGNVAKLNWETNGVGGAFTDMIKSHFYANVYFREEAEKLGGKITKKMGFHSNNDSKHELLAGKKGGGLLGAMETGRCTVRSRAMLLECKEFVQKGGKVYHVRSKFTTDEASEGSAHGDRVTAAGTAVLMLPFKRGKAEEAAKTEGAPEGSVEWELERHEMMNAGRERNEAFAW